MGDTYDHPIAAFLRNVALGTDPTRADVDEVVKEVLAGIEDPPMTSDQLRSKLRTAADAIVRYRTEGATGAARSEARESGERLAQALDGYEPPKKFGADEMNPKTLAAMAYGEITDPDAERLY